MGWQALVCHANGKKHELHVDRKRMFFKPKKVIVLDQETFQTSVSSSQDTEQTIDIAVNDSAQTSSSFSQDTERTIDLMLNNSARQKSEIIWALKSVCSGYSNNSSSDINKVFATMFPDSKIAQKFQLGPDKLKYICNFGIALYFKDVLKEMLKKSDLYVICFDESLNDITQSCQIDVLIRYFDSVDRKVKMRYLDCRFLGHSSHRDWFDQYNITVQGLDNCKICQISMDGPSVNPKFLQKVQDDRVENEQPALIDAHGVETEKDPKWFLSNSSRFSRKEG